MKHSNDFIIKIKTESSNSISKKIKSVLLNVEYQNKVLIIKNFLNNTEIQCIFNEVRNLLLNNGLGRKNYNKFCKNFYHMEENTKEDDLKRLDRNEPLRPRNQRVFKLLPWNNYRQDLIKLVKRISIFRNIIGGRSKYYGLNIKHGYFNFIQVIQYQPGLGYIAKHNDKHFYNKYSISSPFEMLVMLSTRGKDYAKGGLFIERDNEIIDLEEHLQAGDIVVYNVKNNHGVKKVFNYKANLEDFNNPSSKLLNGRISLLVTPYLISSTLGEKTINTKNFKSWIY